MQIKQNLLPEHFANICLQNFQKSLFKLFYAENSKKLNPVKTTQYEPPIVDLRRLHVYEI